MVIRVAITQFDELAAGALRALIGDDDGLQLVADGVRHAQLTAAIARYRPHVAILDFDAFGLPRELHEIRRVNLNTRLVVLAERPSPTECRQLLAYGATACLAKDTPARDVVHAVYLASRGMHVLPPGTGSPEGGGDGALTSRESEILALLQGGRSNAEAARELDVSIEAVRDHARRIYRKLGLSARRREQPRR